MARLRDPDAGCPWDLEQDFASIAPYTIEEAYGVNNAFISPTGGSVGIGFAIPAETAAPIVDKLVRRHPHVFGDDARGDSARQLTRWEDIKAAERAGAAPDADNSALAGVARNLPALQRAEKLGARAARVGFDWRSASAVREKVDEELAELDDALARQGVDGAAEVIDEELGDLLFSIVQWARHLDVDPAGSLRRASAKFERRFRHMERALGDALDGLDDAALDAAWQAAKRDAG